MLTQCPALAHLNLSGNQIGDAGADSLAEVLGQYASLTHLDPRSLIQRHRHCGQTPRLLLQASCTASSLPCKRSLNKRHDIYLIASLWVVREPKQENKTSTRCFFATCSFVFIVWTPVPDSGINGNFMKMV